MKFHARLTQPFQKSHPSIHPSIRSSDHPIVSWWFLRFAPILVTKSIFVPIDLAPFWQFSLGGVVLGLEAEFGFE